MPPARRVKPRSPEHAALGEAVRTVRTESGMTQEDLADAAGTDLTQVGGIERGRRNPSYTTLLRLATALDTSVGQLATLADELRAASK
ncbi:MAG: helix-turn-helix domain-containing protein [Nitrososphaerota archaeon]